MRWSDACGATDEGPAVFLVAPAYRAGVLAWARRQPVATVSRRDLHGPAVEAWSVLDGGILRLHRHPAAALPPGLRILGFAALRLVVAELGLEPPAALPGERGPTTGPDELRRAHRSADPAAAHAVEQAELLASCIDPPTLRWVATTLTLERVAH